MNDEDKMWFCLSAFLQNTKMQWWVALNVASEAFHQTQFQLLFGIELKHTTSRRFIFNEFSEKMNERKQHLH